MDWIGVGEHVEVKVASTGETAEGLCDFLFSEGALGLVTEDLAGEPGRFMIRATFSAAFPIGPIVERLTAYQRELAALGLSCTTGGAEILEVPGQDWERVWIEKFTPVLVGKRLLVIPPWHLGPFPEDRLPIRILPAMAFGTGYDATTRLCLEALEATADRWAGTRGPVVLDLGTGTGILAIAAALLGASRVVAMDTDPAACLAAGKNLVLNERANQIQVICGGVESLRPGRQFDLLLANLDTQILCPLLDSFHALLAPGGRVIAGGIQVEELPALMAALERLPLRIVKRRSGEEWLCLTLEVR